MNNEFSVFKSEMDSWIKEINSKLNIHQDISSTITDHHENIEHNYELIQDMRSEIKKLKEEISTLRIIQYMHLKSEETNKIKN